MESSTQSADALVGRKSQSSPEPQPVNLDGVTKNEKVDDAAEQSPPRSPSTSTSALASSKCARSNAQPQERNNMDQTAKETESDDSNECAVETRRFTRRFIQNVINTYENDPECTGNILATAKKFGIHRTQLENWLLESVTEKTEPEPENPEPVGKEELSPLIEKPQPLEVENTRRARISDKCSTSGSRRETRKGKPTRSSSRSKKTDASRKANESKSGQLDEPQSSTKTIKYAHVREHKTDSRSPTDSREAYDLSKMSSSSMALSLNLSMNSNTQPATRTGNNTSTNAAAAAAAAAASAAMSQYSLNNNNPYLTSSLLRLFPNANANPYNYNYPLNTNGNGMSHSHSHNKPANGDRERDRDRDRDRERHHSDSPTNLSTASGGDSSQRTTPNNYSFGHNNNQNPESPLDVVDEVAYLYPDEDFTLLRQAMIRQEVTLTKLKMPAPEPGRMPQHRSSDNPTNLTTHRNRKTPPPTKSAPASSNSVPQHQGVPIDLIRQQSEYLKLLQQSGFTLPPFPPSMAADMSIAGFGGNSSDSPNYPPWFHSLATATAMNLVGNSVSEQSASSSKNRDLSSRKKPSYTLPTFATPKLPSSAPFSSTSSSLNAKPKTVAAALAASRLSPSSYRNPNSPYSDYSSRNKMSPRKRQRSKLPSMASRKSYAADDDFVDPTSMLEVVTTPASEHSTDAYVRDTPPLSGAAAANSSMNPLHFLNQLLLESPGNKNIFPDLSMAKHMDNLAKAKPVIDTNGNGIDGNGSDHQESSLKTTPELSSSDSTKNMVLHAFFHDNEVNGDARALARKFGLSGRVVMKWIKESTSRESRMNGMGNHTSPPENSFLSPPNVSTRVNGNGGTPPTNGDLNLAMAKYMNNFETASLTNRYYANKINPPVNGDHAEQDASTNNNETDSYLLPNINSAKNLQKANNLNTTSTSVNKRKNSKPNQICDLEEDDSFIDEPVDMIVPNKRPHLSYVQDM